MIIYFSGTGNSRYIAESIAAQINDTLINAGEYIKSGRKAEFNSETPYVFVSPTYAWRIPHVFSDFIENSFFSGSNFAYFVMTCGTDIGNAKAYLRKLCAKKSFQYRGTQKILMPENYVAMYDVTEKTEAEQIISQAAKIIPDISERIIEGKVLGREKADIIGLIKSSIINPVFYSLFVNAHGFRVSDKCIGCGKCETLCPLNNIKLTGGKPVYGDKCTHCMACICACPTEAIEYKNRTVGKARYYNSTSLKDFPGNDIHN